MRQSLGITPDGCPGGHHLGTAVGPAHVVTGQVVVAGEDIDLPGFGCWCGNGGCMAGLGLGGGGWCAAGPVQVF